MEERRYWLGFQCRSLGREDAVYFTASPQVIFKPIGLMIWDVPPDALISKMVFGQSEQLLVSCDPVPARIFTRANSYEHLRRLIECGEESFSDWFAQDAVSPAQRIELCLKSETPNAFLHTQVAMWGLSKGECFSALQVDVK